MAWSRPSSRSHRRPSSAAAAASWPGSVTSISRTSPSAGSLRAVRRVSESPRPAPLSTTSAPSCWADRATAKASEASVSTPVTRMRFPSRSPMRRQGTAAPGRAGSMRPAVRWSRGSTVRGPGGGVPKVWPMRIGILGGTGPAGRGLAVRLAAAGDEVVLGSRDADRAAGVAAGLVEAWPDHALAVTGRVQRGLRRRRPGRHGHPVGRRRGHRQAPRRCAGRQGRGVDGQRPGQGGPGVPRPHAAPRLGGRHPPGRAARSRWCPPRSTTCPPPRWRS